MKKRKFLFSPGLLLAAVFLSAGMVASAQSVRDSRTKSKSYAVSSETTLEVENKYGTILIVPWNKDSVKIDAEIFLEAKNSSKLRKLKNDIDISFTGTRTYVIARTEIGDGGSRLGSELRALSNTLVSNTTVEVNYTIYLPDYIDLVLTNKFGDIYIDDLNGDVDISLSNGVLKANHIPGTSRVELIFAKAMIRELGTTSLKMSYGELTLGSVKQLDLSSKSSDIQIDSADVIKIDSRRDKMQIGEVEYLYGISSFTDITIQDFIREADCEMSYGNLIIENVSPDFSKINIESDYTDITLYTSAESNYTVDILRNDKAVVRLPQQNAVLQTNRTGEDFLTTVGRIGSGKSQKHINIKADHKCYINISIRQP